MDISVKALEEAVSIRRQIDGVERRLSSILGGAPARPTAVRPTAAAKQAARYFSPSTRAKLSAAARARWARLKGGTKPAPSKKKGALTAAGRVAGACLAPGWHQGGGVDDESKRPVNQP